MESQVFSSQWNSVELLAPVRSWESLRAAVQNGADAVYLGLRSFHARAGAGGFSLEELEEVVSYAHERDTAVHITLNVLIDGSDLKEAQQFALAADRIGVDALILQDLGLASLLAGKVQAKLHASTQMTILNAEGAAVLERLGFRRCIPARELSLEEIRRLCQETSLEVEVFAHGALCMSYSGQCLMSSRLGGRSGNRGTCAQPCRLAYTVEKADQHFPNTPSYCLSPTDLCSLSYLDQLVNTGIRSLKIEGRLKSPEYVAFSTRAYRHALDRIASGKTPIADPKEIQELAQLFSRSGFSAGHQLGRMPLSAITQNAPGRTGLLCGILEKPVTIRPLPDAPVTLYDAPVRASLPLHKGDGVSFEGEIGQTKPGGTINAIFRQGKQVPQLEAGEQGILAIAGTPPSGRKLRLFKTHDAALVAACQESFRPGVEHRKCPIYGQLTMKLGTPATLCIWDSRGNRSTVRSPSLVEAARNQGTELTRIRQQLDKLGDTPFYWADLQITADEGLFCPVSLINQLRRDATEALLKERRGRLTP